MSRSKDNSHSAISREMVYCQLYRYMSAWLWQMLEEAEDPSCPPLSYQDLFFQFKSTFCHCIDLEHHFDSLLSSPDQPDLALYLDKLRRRADGLEQGLILM